MPDAPTLRWFTTREALSTLLESRWPSEDATHSVFLTRPWLSSWLDIYRPDDLHVLTLWRGERLSAVLPLTGRRTAGVLRGWEFAGAGPLTPNHLDVVGAPADVADSVVPIADALADAADQWDFLDLDKLDGRSATADALAERFRQRGLDVGLGSSAVCPAVRLPADYDDYLRGLSRNARHHIQRRLRKLSREHGNVRFRRAHTEQDVERAMRALVALHQARWRLRGQPGAFADPRAVRFHMSVARAALREGTLRLRWMEADGAIIAVEYGFRIGEAIQKYQSGFDSAWATYAPATLLGAHVIEESILEGARVLDFLEGEESYKGTWCDHALRDRRLRVYSPSGAGRLAAARDRAVTAGVALAQRHVPAAARQAALRAAGHVRSRRRGRDR